MGKAGQIDEWLSDLRELGCSDMLTDQIAELLCACRLDESIELLRKHKQTLLEELHCCEKKVDLLDFLLYQLRRAQAEHTASALTDRHAHRKDGI